LRRHRQEGVSTFRSELCWREFYADVLWHRPASAREYLRSEYARMRYEPPGDEFEAWCQGKTGFPIVDAGMRQLQAEGWIHNRVRMIVASFLIKDLHVEWQHGARWFMRWLRDGDLASNQHGWQWVAGSGTDAAPYFRVFNPVSQGLKFDPDGGYVRRYVSELSELPGGAAHEPWNHPDGYAGGYPERIVDHAAERLEALARYQEIKK
jgi:deoxyribodipyrimidine photo-lyase